MTPVTVLHLFDTGPASASRACGTSAVAPFSALHCFPDSGQLLIDTAPLPHPGKRV